MKKIKGQGVVENFVNKYDATIPGYYWDYILFLFKKRHLQEILCLLYIQQHWRRKSWVWACSTLTSDNIEHSLNYGLQLEIF